MSIIDRITALFNRPNFLNSPKAKFNQMYQVFPVNYPKRKLRFAKLSLQTKCFMLPYVLYLYESKDKHTGVDAMLDNDSLCQTHLSVTSPKIILKLRSVSSEGINNSL